jgi:hypothetical protein
LDEYRKTKSLKANRNLLAKQLEQQNYFQYFWVPMYFYYNPTLNSATQEFYPSYKRSMV